MTHALPDLNLRAMPGKAGGAFAGPWRKLAALGLLAALLPSGPVRAEGDGLQRQSEEPRIEFDFDAPTPADHHLTDSFSVGAAIEFELESEINFDLDDTKDKDVVEFQPTLKLSAAFEPISQLRSFLELELSRDFLLKTPGSKDADMELELTEAYIALPDVLPGVTPTLGRFRFNDEREWLVDEELDGLQFVVRNDGFAVEASVTREELLPKDLLGDHDDDEPNNFYLRGLMALGEDSQASAYAFYRDGREQDAADELLFIGTQSFGKLTSNIDYWLELGLVTGEEDDRDVLGYGADLGMTHEWRDIRFRPAVTLGAAFGSGDDGEGRDTAFRQTGLQGNEAKFGGVTKFSYYGEVLDPELSNLWILTAGVGARPTKRSSVDLIYHGYLQARRSDELRDSEIDEDPSGRSRNIGQELDLIIGIREIDNIDLEIIGGVFLPGEAFDDDDDLAFFGGLSLEIKF